MMKIKHIYLFRKVASQINVHKQKRYIFFYSFAYFLKKIKIHPFVLIFLIFVETFIISSILKFVNIFWNL